MVKAVLFDLDETLFDRRATLHAFLTDQFQRFETHLGSTDLESWRARFISLDANGRRHKSLVYPQLLDEFGGDASAADNLLEDYYANSTRQAVAMPGLAETLSTLQNRGLAIGLITNGETRLQSRTMNALGLQQQMQTILISEAAGLRKPDPELFRTAARSLKVAVADCLYVGDNPEADVLGASKAGLKSIWFNPRQYAWPAELEPNPGQTIVELGELINLLDRA